MPKNCPIFKFSRSNFLFLKLLRQNLLIFQILSAKFVDLKKNCAKNLMILRQKIRDFSYAQKSGHFFHCALVNTEQYLIVAGGYNGGSLDSVEMIYPNSNEWKEGTATFRLLVAHFFLCTTRHTSCAH